MKRLTLSLLAAALLAAPIASSATLAGPAVAFAQTADEPERAAPPDGSPLQSGYGPALAAPPADVPEDGPALAPVVETRPTTSGNPYYGPAWNGPVNHAPLPVCPAWYSPHTACAPASTPTSTVP